MLCDDCKQQPASVHLTQIINGQKTELHLCLACAGRRSIQVWPIPVFASPAFHPAVSHQPKSRENRACAKCGLSWGEFMNTGFLGCTDCYESFSELLAKTLSQSYGSIRHPGKIPQHAGANLKIRRELTGLRKNLDKAVAAENFEEAARLRDRIRRLEPNA